MMSNFRKSLIFLWHIKRNVNTAHIVKTQPIKVPAKIKKCLTDVLDIDPSAAEAITKKYDFSYARVNEIRKSAKVLRDLGIEEDTLRENARILTVRSSLLKQRYDCLAEIGFVKIGAPELLQYNFLVDSSTSSIKSQNVLPDSVDPCKNLVKILELDDTLEYSIRRQLGGSPDSVPIHELRRIILEEYLVWKLQCRRDEAQEIFDISSALRKLSMCQLKQLMSVFVEEFGFDFSYLREHHNLFNCLPKHLSTILTRSSSCGLDIQKLVMKSGKILFIDVNRIFAIHQLLKDFNIADNAIAKFPLIFQLNLAILRQRLTAMDVDPDFQCFKNHNRYLLAVYRYPKVKERLSKLNAMGLSLGLSLGVLCTSESMFNGFVQRQRGMSELEPSLHFLMDKLDMSSEDIMATLRKHPRHTHISLSNMKMVLTFLYNLGISETQIITGLQIICYDIKMLANVWNSIENHPEVQPFDEWLKNKNLLQLIVYFLEKEYQKQP